MDDRLSGLSALTNPSTKTKKMSISRRKMIKNASTGLLSAGLMPLIPGFHIGKPFKKLSLAQVRRDISDYLETIRDKGGPYGAYRIGPGQRTDLYSSCDVAQIRTIWGEDLSSDLSNQQRTEWIHYINSFADRKDGSYFDRYNHSKFHANGMVIGALGPLGGKQAYPVKLYNEFNTTTKIIPWLENINWSRLWPASHKFWGGIICYTMSSKCTEDWLLKVFDWLEGELNPETGFWRKGIRYDDRHQGLGGSVHIYPLYEHHQRPFQYPREVIDKVLAMQLPNKRWLIRPGVSFMHYLELDALYALKYMSTLVPDYRKKNIKKSGLRLWTGSHRLLEKGQGRCSPSSSASHSIGCRYIRIAAAASSGDVL